MKSPMWAPGAAARQGAHPASTSDPSLRLPVRRNRPLLVQLYAAIFSESGIVGRVARRRAARLALRSIPAAVSVAIAVLLLLRVFVPLHGGAPQALALAALLATLIGISLRRARRAAAGARAGVREQIELGSLFLLAAYVLAQSSGMGPGGLYGPLFPVVYLVMAFLVAFLSRGVGLAMVAFALALELALGRDPGSRAGPGPETLAHGLFLVLFAALYQLVLGIRVAVSRRMEQAAVDRRLREIEERAREFRLLSPVGSDEDPEEQERRWKEASVFEVETALRGALEVAEVALEAHTCAVFVLSGDDSQLILRDCRSQSEQVGRHPLPAGEGALGAVVRRAAPVRLHGDIRSASYYEDGTRPHALLAVPLLDHSGGHVRGVLLADRAQPKAFTESDERLLTVLAGEILRAIASERLLSQMKRTRDEQERFYEALERLNRTTKPQEVFDALLQVSAGQVPVEFGAITLVEQAGGKTRHLIARLLPGELAKPGGALEGARFPDNAGLVASAVRLGSSLPGKELKIGDAVIFDEATRIKGLRSLKIIPLKTGEIVLGTLVLGTRREKAFGPDTVREMEVVAMQAADSILRARLFEQTERLATTDGLTNLLNHRTFQTRLDEHLAQSVRYGKKLSLIICDIDHFKSVNDTYGHPVGDRVLQGVAQALSREARATDLVARYGGEEFALIMPETDATGALATAERIRERLGQTAFETELGSLKVTLSLGIASCPEDAQKKAELIELADSCLYQAKRSGRNRTVLASALRPARRTAS